MGRKNSATQNVDALKVADETTQESLSKLEEAITSLDSIQKEAKLIDEYRGLVEEGRQQFQKEIEAILPGAKLSGGSLSEDELNIFMTHAYRYTLLWKKCTFHPKIHILKISIFTKSTFLKSQFSQNSHF